MNFLRFEMILCGDCIKIKTKGYLENTIFVVFCLPEGVVLAVIIAEKKEDLTRGEIFAQQCFELRQ